MKLVDQSNNRRAVSSFPSEPKLSMVFFNRWIILTQRFDNSLNFDRNWQAYQYGFNDGRGKDGNFWLGLEKMHQLTYSGQYQLRFLLQRAVDDLWHEAYYDLIKIDSEAQNYRWHFGLYSGDAGDALRYDNKEWNLQDMEFATCDHPGSRGPYCPCKYSSGWWYKGCMEASLTAKNYADENGYEWNAPGQSPYFSQTSHLKASLMLIRML